MGFDVLIKESIVIRVKVGKIRIAVPFKGGCFKMYFFVTTYTGVNQRQLSFTNGWRFRIKSVRARVVIGCTKVLFGQGYFVDPLCWCGFFGLNRLLRPQAELLEELAKEVGDGAANLHYSFIADFMRISNICLQIFGLRCPRSVKEAFRGFFVFCSGLIAA